MSRYYAEELKSSLIQKMLPPSNYPVGRLSEETGITRSTLYTWRKQAIFEGASLPEFSVNPEKWSSEEKFEVVIETSPLNEAELSEYCRKKGLYPDQVEDWKTACLHANRQASTHQGKLSSDRKRDQKRIKALEKELNRKEKALAETAALLVLAKKARAIWGEAEGD